MTESYKDFADMAAARSAAIAQKNGELFDAVLRDHFEDFDRITKWPQLASQVSEIKGMRFFKTPAMGHSLNVELSYEHDKKSGKVLGSINKDGILSIKLPRELSQVNRDVLFADILGNIDCLHPNIWVELDKDLVVAGIGDKKHGGEGHESNTPPPLDSRRIEFLIKQPDFIAIAQSASKGMDGYIAALFQEMIVWENQNLGNAAFVKPLENALSAREIEESQSYSGRKKLVDRYVAPYVAHTRAELVASGAERVAHLPYNDWIAQMTERLNGVSPKDRAVHLEGKRQERKSS